MKKTNYKTNGFKKGYKKEYKPTIKTREPRTNRRIKVLEVRVIDESGKQLGVMNTFDAWKLAEFRGLDLVEVSPMAKPPVCKMMDYGKFKYVQKKNASEAKKKQQAVELKEVQFSPKISVNDFAVKTTQIKRFVEAGNKVKVTVMLKGREAVHPDIGFTMLNNILNDFPQGELDIESVPKMEGRKYIVMMIKSKKNP